ncbi:hypothetical protein ACFL2H_09675 [Planctomycetota bacterium]
MDKVQERLTRTIKALESQRIPFGIVGGHAVRAWVAQVDESAVRTTRDVDILIQRSDLPAVIELMEGVGFVYRQISRLGKAGRMDVFLDGPDGKVRDGVHLLFAGERVHPDDEFSTPSLDEIESVAAERTIKLEALVKMKLNVFRDKDRVHLRDMLEVGLIDESWTQLLPRNLAERLQELINNPD